MGLPREEITNRFSYHPANADSAPRHAQIRSLFEDLADTLNDLLPDGRDKSLALTDLQSAMHWSNSAVAMQNPVADDPERART